MIEEYFFIGVKLNIFKHNDIKKVPAKIYTSVRSSSILNYNRNSVARMNIRRDILHIST